MFRCTNPQHVINIAGRDNEIKQILKQYTADIKELKVMNCLSTYEIIKNLAIRIYNLIGFLFKLIQNIIKVFEKFAHKDVIVE